jgi:zinc protease
MKRHNLLVITVLLVSASTAMAQTQAPAAKPSASAAAKSSAAASTGVPSKWSQVPIPPLAEFKPQLPKRIQLSNGLVIFLQEDHELPVISGTFTIRGGGIEVPNSKTGMMGIYGQTWRLGGTSARTGDQLDDYLEGRAARVSTSGGLTNTSLTFNSLKQDFDDVFKIAVELLRDPAFREDKITLAKTQANGGIARRNDDLGGIVSRETSRIIYGADNPYGRVSEYDTIAAITHDDLVAFHKNHLYPNYIILGVYGDFDPQTMEATLRRTFESWAKGPEYQKPKIEFRDPKPGIYFAEKEDVNQAEIRMGHLSIQRDNPDLYAVDVMDQIFFSGGFSARFVDAIRTKRGLAYEAGGNISAPFDHPGTFVAGGGTKSNTTVEGVKAMKEEVQNVLKEPATAQELKRAKDAILNNFIFRFDSKDKVLAERVTYEFYGYPADFLERYRAGIEKVTLADVSRVAGKYIHPQQLATVVVGHAQEFEASLTTLGQVTTLDISIPPPGGGNKSASAGATAAPKAAENTSEARALLTKVIDAMGGAAKLQSVKSIKQTASVVQKTEQGEVPLQVETVIVFPNQLHTTIQTPMGAMTRVVTPSVAYMSMGPNSRDLPASMRDEAVKDLRRNTIYVAQHAAEPTLKVSLGATEKVGDVDAQILDVNADGTQTRWYVDPKTGRVLRSQYQSVGPNGPAQVTSDFSDFKPVDGITFPFTTKQVQGGQEAAIKTNKVEINPQVDPKLFEKPTATPQP